MKPQPHRKRAILEWITALSAKGSAVFESAMIYACHVGLAKEVEQLRIARKLTCPLPPENFKPSGKILTITDGSPAFPFNDEDRILTELHGRNYNCPQCSWLGTAPALERVMVRGVPQYRVKCTSKWCGHATGWQDSSQLAVIAWKSEIVLTRGRI